MLQIEKHQAYGNSVVNKPQNRHIIGHDVTWFNKICEHVLHTFTFFFGYLPCFVFEHVKNPVQSSNLSKDKLWRICGESTINESSYRVY